MKILYTIAKNRHYAFYMVIFNKPIQKGIVSYKRFTHKREYAIIKKQMDCSKRQVKIIKWKKLFSILDVQNSEGKTLVEVDCQRSHIINNDGLMENVIGLYFDFMEDKQLNTYQMNIIKRC